MNKLKKPAIVILSRAKWILAFFGDMLVGLTIIPERASLELGLSNYGDDFKIFKAKIRYCLFCGREFKNGAVL